LIYYRQVLESSRSG
jgi:hypothetical protein